MNPDSALLNYQRNTIPQFGYGLEMRHCLLGKNRTTIRADGDRNRSQLQSPETGHGLLTALVQANRKLQKWCA
jgi:hypothetical protein